MLKKLLFVSKLVFAIILLFSQAESLSQTDTIRINQSPFSVGFSFGYTGIPNNSPLTSDIVGTNIVNGMSFGILFEYKFKYSKVKLQFLSESNFMNFEKNGKENYESISFNTIGIKFPVKILYFSTSVGIMTGRETQFIRSFYIGHEFFNEKNRSFFIQIGGAETDFKDVFLKISFGTNFNL
ncbi:MAG: hypothetical protein KIT33_11865 [Candidatus Kapabacteria bacterium]|nr:hypothetical protein [Ignavibacteriota bacterium]MCW5885656.1 hypothetical protein [Candidatus Kapabacteria bacterium]